MMMISRQDPAEGEARLHVGEASFQTQIAVPTAGETRGIMASAGGDPQASHKCSYQPCPRREV